MSLFAHNRQRLCERLRARDDVPKNAVIVLQGGEQLQQYCTDRDITFRQVGSGQMSVNRIRSKVVGESKK